MKENGKGKKDRLVEGGKYRNRSQKTWNLI